MLREGARAPDFRLADHEGREVGLADLIRGYKALILYFYPKDDTPGCTTEACGFRDVFSALRRAGANVVGVSVDSPESHRRFIGKYSLPFQLLSDMDGRVARLYDAFREDRGTCARKTFVIDSSGIVRAVFPKVSPDEHAREILDTLKRLQLIRS
ncbi:MAG: peroxiredoxin [Nitrososphaerota archaeon]